MKKKQLSKRSTTQSIKLQIEESRHPRGEPSVTGVRCILAGGQRVVGNCSETSRSLLSTEQTGSCRARSRTCGEASIYFIEIVRRFVSIKPLSVPVIRLPRRCTVVVVEVFIGLLDVVSVVVLVDASLFCERKTNCLSIYKIYLNYNYK